MGPSDDAFPLGVVSPYGLFSVVLVPVGGQPSQRQDAYQAIKLSDSLRQTPLVLLQPGPDQAEMKTYKAFNPVLQPCGTSCKTLNDVPKDT